MSNSSKYNMLNAKFNKYIYVTENNDRSGLNIVFDMNDFEPHKYKKCYGEIVEYLMYIYVEAMKKLENYSKNLLTMHIHVETCTIRNFSIKLFKYLMNFFGEYIDSAGDNVIDYIYIHSKSKFFSIVYNMVKSQLTDSLRKRMVLIKVDSSNSVVYDQSNNESRELSI